MAHSAPTFLTPRNRNWRKPRACLICPKTGSVHFSAEIKSLITALVAPKSRTSLAEPATYGRRLAAKALERSNAKAQRPRSTERRSPSDWLLLMATILACAILVYAHTGHPLARRRVGALL